MTMSDEKRSFFHHPGSKKDPQAGDALATCGHVAAGGQAYLFDGLWTHDGQEIRFIACCQACAEAANFHVSALVLTDVVVVGDSS